MVTPERAKLPADLRVQCAVCARMAGGRTWGNPGGEPVFILSDRPWQFFHRECIPTTRPAP